MTIAAVIAMQFTVLTGSGYFFESQARANIAAICPPPIVVTRSGGFGEFCNFYVDTLF
jgi:hypothetical protein